MAGLGKKGKQRLAERQRAAEEAAAAARPPAPSPAPPRAAAAGSQLYQHNTYTGPATPIPPVTDPKHEDLWWPINYTFRALHDFKCKKDDTTRGDLNLRAGQEGAIINTERDSQGNFVIIEVRVPETGEQARIPRQLVQINRSVQRGDFTVAANAFAAPRIQEWAMNFEAPDKVARAIVGFLETASRNLHALENLIGSQAALTNLRRDSSAVKRVAQQLHSAMKKTGLVPLINQSDLSFESFRQLPELTTNSHKGKKMTILYMWIYTDFAKGAKDSMGQTIDQWDVAFRIGSTVDPHGRTQKHELETKRANHDSGRHYQLANTANDRRCYVLCQYEVPPATEELHLHEEILQQLFGTRFAHYFEDGYLDRYAARLKAVGTDETQRISRILSETTLYYQARIVHNLANESFGRQVGDWTPVIHREGFGKYKSSSWSGWRSKTSRVFGLDYATPLANLNPVSQLGDQAISYVIEASVPGVEGGMTLVQFSRPESLGKAGGNRMTVMSFGNVIHFEIHKGLGDLDLDDQVTITFEMMNNHTPHPKAWARLCKIGLYSNWDFANCWAVRINWRDKNGKEHQYYIQRTTPGLQLRSGNEKNDPCITDAYVQGLAMARWLFRKTTPESVRQPYDKFIARTPQMLQVKMNFYNQQLQVGPFMQPDPVLEVARTRKTFQELVTEYKKAGFANVNMPITDAVLKNASSNLRGIGRTGCDYCHTIVCLTTDTRGPNHRCELLPNNNRSCKTCAAEGRPCSVTKSFRIADTASLRPRMRPWKVDPATQLFKNHIESLAFLVIGDEVYENFGKSLPIEIERATLNSIVQEMQS